MYEFIEYIPNYCSGFEPKTFKFKDFIDLKNKLKKIGLLVNDNDLKMDYEPEICTQIRLIVKKWDEWHTIGYFKDDEKILLGTFNYHERVDIKINDIIRKLRKDIKENYDLSFKVYAQNEEIKKLKLEIENLYLLYGTKEDKKEIRLKRGQNIFG